MGEMLSLHTSLAKMLVAFGVRVRKYGNATYIHYNGQHTWMKFIKGL
jgi:hypothetical protein